MRYGSSWTVTSERPLRHRGPPFRRSERNWPSRRSSVVGRRSSESRWPSAEPDTVTSRVERVRSEFPAPSGPRHRAWRPPPRYRRFGLPPYPLDEPVPSGTILISEVHGLEVGIRVVSGVDLLQRLVKSAFRKHPQKHDGVGHCPQPTCASEQQPAISGPPAAGSAAGPCAPIPHPRTAQPSPASRNFLGLSPVKSTVQDSSDAVTTPTTARNRFTVSAEHRECFYD